MADFWFLGRKVGRQRSAFFQNQQFYYLIPKRPIMSNQQATITEFSTIDAEQFTEHYYNFLLVNSKSGNLAGKELVESKPYHLTFTHQQAISRFFIVDMYNQTQRTEGLIKASNLSQSQQNVRVIICGGDGTIEWVLDEAIKCQVNFERVVFGVLPIGTGNDFAQSLGWKGFKFSGFLSELRNLAVKLSESRVGTYDIWESTIQCGPNGKITQIKNGKQVTIEKKRLVRNFTNYFGIGTDARICYIAQKLNAEGVTLKKIAYGFAGFLSFWIYWGSLSSKITIKQKKPEPHPAESLQKKISEVNMLDQHEQHHEEMDLDQEEYQKIKMGRFDQCLTFVNSTSSMELERIWQTPFQIKGNRKISQQEKRKYEKQAVDDQMIQVVSYWNEISLWFQRVIHMARKVTQGRGPYKIHFKKRKNIESNFIQINGEPYKIQDLQLVTIEPSPKFPHNKIRVLVYRS